MKKAIWKIAMIVGICPFLAAVFTGLYHMFIESWKFTDWVILYSVVYWPTYVLGLILIVIGIFGMLQGKETR